MSVYVCMCVFILLISSLFYLDLNLHRGPFFVFASYDFFVFVLGHNDDIMP